MMNTSSGSYDDDSTKGSSSSRLLDSHVRKSTPPPFLMKTYVLVEDPATDGVVSWNEDGTGFVVWQPAEFARDIIPTHFKHSNFSSFVRQLNTYGFRKIATSRWEFCNEMFRKGERGFLSKICRRKPRSNKEQPTTASQQQQQQSDDEEQRSSSSTSSLSQHCKNLMDENKRLKKENGDLSSELGSMKRKCQGLLDLLAKCANTDKSDGDDEINQGGPLILKLFGVRLEVDHQHEGEAIRERNQKRKRAQELITQSASILLSQSCN